MQQEQPWREKRGYVRLRGELEEAQARHHVRLRGELEGAQVLSMLAELKVRFQWHVRLGLLGALILGGLDAWLML